MESARVKSALSRLRRLAVVLSGTIAAIGIGLLMIHVSVDVVSRFAFNAPIRGTIEFVAFWYMTAIGFGGLALARSQRDHIAVTLVSDRLHDRSRTAMLLFADLTTLLVAGAIGYFGLIRAIERMPLRETGGAAGVPIWFMKFVVPIGIALYLIHIVVDWILGDRENPPALVEAEFEELQNV